MTVASHTEAFQWFTALIQSITEAPRDSFSSFDRYGIPSETKELGIHVAVKVILFCYRRLDKERQRKYDRELEEMRQRVENRPLLLERVPGASAGRHTAQATTMTKAGLTEEEIQKLNHNLEHTS